MNTNNTVDILHGLLKSNNRSEFLSYDFYSNTDAYKELSLHVQYKLDTYEKMIKSCDTSLEYNSTRTYNVHNNRQVAQNRNVYIGRYEENLILKKRIRLWLSMLPSDVIVTFDLL